MCPVPLLLCCAKKYMATYLQRGSYRTVIAVPKNLVAKCFPAVMQQQQEMQVQVCVMVDEADVTATAGGCNRCSLYAVYCVAVATLCNSRCCFLRKVDEIHTPNVY
jgi:hypothetical protein